MAGLLRKRGPAEVRHQKACWQHMSRGPRMAPLKLTQRPRAAALHSARNAKRSAMCPQSRFSGL
jgi:hypothetical protein